MEGVIIKLTVQGFYSPEKYTHIYIYKTNTTALCKPHFDANVTQAKERKSNVYLNPSIFHTVMKLHLNERELFVIQAFGNNRLRVNSSRSAGECVGEIKARQHCLSLDPDAALLCWGIAL